MANSIGSSHLTFGTNLAKCDIVLYLCAIYNRGSASPPKVITFSITMQILSIDQFYIDVVVQPGYQIDLLRFSMVAMDKEDI